MCDKCSGTHFIQEKLGDKTINIPCTCNHNHPDIIFLNKCGADDKLKEYVLKPHPDQRFMKSLLNRNEKILLICGDYGRAKTTMLLKLALWYRRRQNGIFYMESRELFRIMSLSPNVTDYYELQNDTWGDMVRKECHHVFIDDIGNHKIDSEAGSDIFRQLLKINKPLAITSNFWLNDETVDKKTGVKKRRKEETLLRSIFNPGCLDILDSDQCLIYETEGASFR